ncbi:MAG: DUF192 domain-containing protein [Notoacmeibacter sp.]
MTVYRALLRVFAALLFFVSASFIYANEPMTVPIEPVLLVINTQKGKLNYFVEIADTDIERSAGLMFRQDFPSDRAMLFDFGRSRIVSMWMKNTPLPLDMLFVDETGLVVGIAENTKPQSLDVISSPGPVRYVLEINAGEARKKSIQTGDRLVHPFLRQ